MQQFVMQQAADQQRQSENKVNLKGEIINAERYQLFYAFNHRFSGIMCDIS